MTLLQTEAIDGKFGHGNEGGSDIEHQGRIGDIPVVGVDVAIVARLGLEHIDVAESLSVLDHAVNAEEPFGLAVEDDISPNNRVRLFLMRRGKSGLIHHNSTFGIHLIIGLESHVVVAAKSVRAFITRYRR